MGIDNPVHIIFLAAVALIVLGPRRLPEVARALGKGMREFREAMTDASGDILHGSDHEDPHHDPSTPAGQPVVYAQGTVPHEQPFVEGQRPVANAGGPVGEAQVEPARPVAQVEVSEEA